VAIRPFEVIHLELLSDQVWPGEELSSWDNLAIRAGRVAEQQATRRTILFRGQPKQWKLAPTLLRATSRGVSGAQLERAERAAMKHFSSQAHLFSDGRLPQEHVDGSVDLAWWALMQHHGAPTRLLDWTASPYVAAYFAAEQFPDDDGAILVIDADALNSHFRASTEAAGGRHLHRTEDDPPGLFAFTLERKTHRLVVQQGYFTVATHPQLVHDELLHDAGAIVRRWVIPGRVKSLVLGHLRTMNVSAQTLFPGLDGLGRSAAELIKTIGAES
jgi:hypothetical protein